MSSIIKGYEYDIFISYRHNDNHSGWVSDFVRDLEKELKATIKETVSIYFDTNPHDGLRDTYNVNKSLEKKLKCLILIPIISQTYCDPKSFAWQNEFCLFNKLAKDDPIGLDITLGNGNVASRILPVKIHELEKQDMTLLEKELGRVLRSIEFIYRASGVNRSLRISDERAENFNHTYYPDQINKVANAIKEIINGIMNQENSDTSDVQEESFISQSKNLPFIKNLARRNVLRASLVYVLIALVFWKVAAIWSGMFDLPENLLKIITIFLIVLFPFAMLLAWLYERSPQGFIRTSSDAAKENPFGSAKRKPFTSITFISLLSVTSLALFLLVPTPSRTESVNIPENIEKSIAVLPFENAGNDPERDFFSDGMMQEILDHLFMIGGLKIPSATSSLRFKGSKLTVKEIARELNVFYILEGNISKSADNVRIIVRLINGKNGNLVWTEDYRCSMTATDILDIQSAVALQVASNLKVVIDPELKRRIETRPTMNTEAYTLFLQARKSYLDDFNKANQMLQRAVQLDPGFADAYAEMGFEIMWSKENTLTREQLLAQVEPLLNKALDLDDNSIVAHHTLAEVKFWYYWDLASVEKEMQIVRKLNPSNNDVRFRFPHYLWALGRNKEAFDICRNNFEQNKTSAYDWIYMASAYARIGERGKALETMVSALQLFPHTVYLIRNSLRVFVESGHYKEAIDLFEKELSEKKLHDFQAETLANVATAYYNEGNKSKSKEILMELLSRNGNFARSEISFSAAQIYVAMGEKDKALQYLEKAYVQHEMDLVDLNTEPGFQLLHGDPRYEDLLQKIGIN